MDSPNHDVQSPNPCQPSWPRTDKIQDHPSTAGRPTVEPMENPSDDVDEGKHGCEILERTGGRDKGDDLNLDVGEKTCEEDEERGGVEVLEVGKNLGGGCKLRERFKRWSWNWNECQNKTTGQEVKSAYGCHSMASLRGVHHNGLERDVHERVKCRRPERWKASMRLKRDAPCFQAEIGLFTGIDCGRLIWTVCSNAVPRCIRGDSSIVGVYTYGKQ